MRLNRTAQALNQFDVGGLSLRGAALAGTEACAQRSSRMSIKFHAFTARRTCRARWTAKDFCGAHRRDKAPIVAAVALKHSVPAFIICEAHRLNSIHSG